MAGEHDAGRCPDGTDRACYGGRNPATVDPPWRAIEVDATGRDRGRKRTSETQACAPDAMERICLLRPFEAWLSCELTTSFIDEPV
jgi:hypothetical protein